MVKSPTRVGERNRLPRLPTVSPKQAQAYDGIPALMEHRRERAPITFQRPYSGAASEVRRVRADLAAVAAGCPVADELVLLASELATNAIMHSRSGEQGATFTVRAELRRGEYARVEVEDLGGGWSNHVGEHDEHGRGLDIVGAIAGDGNWGMGTGGPPGSCVVWARMAWHQAEDA